MVTSPLARTDFGSILFGAAYYAEYALTDRVDTDLDLMKAAGFTVIRVGESVWSTWEPRDGEFNLEWLRPVLDGAHARGISVILGTPTYAMPPWLQVKHPELAAATATDKPMLFGSRQEIDYSNPIFRRYADRVIRHVLETYADHPAVIGFQVDNEPGMVLFHNDGAFEGFKAYLAERYGDVDTLNAEWGLVYWSHLLTSFDELWRPDGNSFPQYDQAWREYQAQLTTDFIAWQAGIVREYSATGQFVTTCIAYPRPAQHDQHLAEGLDISAGNPYYDMQDGLDLQKDLAQGHHWVSTGVGQFFRQADRMWSTRQQPFLVTETDAQSIGGSHQNLPPFPGQLKQAAFGLISRGARMVEYWHWQTLHFGFETYWGGVLPHSQQPGRVYDELAAVGNSLLTIGNALDGYVPDADIAILYSNASKWAFNAFPPLADDTRNPDPSSYYRIFDAFHSGIIEANRQARIVQDTQLAGIDPTTFAATTAALVVPGFYAASDEALAWLRAYAEAGGHLVVGIRTGYGDTEARARGEVAPPRLADVAGVSYSEYSNTFEPTPVRGTGDLALSPDAAGLAWIDGLVPDGAEVLAGYEHPVFGIFPAITTHAAGAGRVTYVGTVPNRALAADLAAWLSPVPESGSWTAAPEGRVLVQSGHTPDAHIRFVFNWSGDTVTLNVPVQVTDLESGSTVPAGTQLTLQPRATLILAEETARH